MSYLLRSSARYIRANYPPAKGWHAGSLLQWVNWCLGEGFLITAHEAPGAPIIGILISRPVANAMDGLDKYKTDPEGPCVFVDLAVASHPRALACLCFAASRRFGQRSSVAWNNLKRDRMNSAPWERVRNALLRKENYGRR